MCVGTPNLWKYGVCVYICKMVIYVAIENLMIYNICSKDIYNIYTIKSIGVKCVATPQSLKIW